MRILIWGTGDMARKLLSFGVEAEIVGYIQSQKTAEQFNGYEVFSPEEAPKDIDYIFVANTYSDDIKEICISKGIDLGRVVFLYKGKTTEWIDSEDIKAILGEANYTRYQAEYGVIEGSFFERDKEAYTVLNTRNNFAVDETCLWPIIYDKYDEAGSTGNYFWQDLWAAKLIIKSGVKEHFDIGSRLDGFIAHLLAADIDVRMIDIREFPTEIEGLSTIVADATSLEQIPDESIKSMSALCSLEHFGLGRYGDPVDPEACFKCFENMQRVLTPGGKLFISLPIGRERVEFNAHRVFYPQTVIDCMDRMELVEFSCTAQGTLESNVDIHKYDNDPHDGNYRYGLFYFVKK